MSPWQGKGQSQEWVRDGVASVGARSRAVEMPLAVKPAVGQAGELHRAPAATAQVVPVAAAQARCKAQRLVEGRGSGRALLCERLCSCVTGPSGQPVGTGWVWTQARGSESRFGGIRSAECPPATALCFPR